MNTNATNVRLPAPSVEPVCCGGGPDGGGCPSCNPRLKAAPPLPRLEPPRLVCADAFCEETALTNLAHCRRHDDELAAELTDDHNERWSENRHARRAAALESIGAEPWAPFISGLGAVRPFGGRRAR